MFSGCTVTSDSKETEIGSNDQVVSPSAGKNTGVILVTSCGVDILEAPGCYFLRQTSSQRV